jgi:3-oxoadipate enol-lactonase
VARLAHTISGDRAAPVVVLGSSLGTTGAMWEPQLAELDRHFRVVRYDHRGHGDSEVPPGRYQIADLGQDVLGLLDELGVGGFCYGGLSLGGMVGMWIAAEESHRVTRLALLCTSAALAAPDAWHQRVAAVRAGGMAAIAEPVVARWFTPGFAASHPDVIAAHQGMMLANSVDGYVGCCEAIAAMDQRDRLPRIQAATLVIAGREDLAIPPSHSEVIAAAVPVARLEILEDAAHLANVQQSAAVSRLLINHFEGG